MKIIEYCQSLKMDTTIKTFVLDILLNELNQGEHFPRPDLVDFSIYKKSGGNMWLLIDGDKIMGTIAVKIEGSHATLKRFFVEKSIRRMGWGNKLYDTAYQHCQKVNVKYIKLNSDASTMIDAYEFYTKKGFAEAHRRQDGYVEMVLTIK